MIECPKCKAKCKPKSTECHKCGVIFARFEIFLAKQAKEKELKKKQLFKKCSVCEKEISKTAESCPHCGEQNSPTPVSTDKTNTQSNKQMAQKEHPLFKVALVIGSVAMLFVVYSVYNFATKFGESLADSKQVAKVETRLDKIEKQFSALSGAHRRLEIKVKKSMNDPSSYKHIKTTYRDEGDSLTIRTLFRGKNGFGALVQSSVTARVDLEGNILKIISQSH